MQAYFKSHLHLLNCAVLELSKSLLKDEGTCCLKLRGVLKVLLSAKLPPQSSRDCILSKSISFFP